MGAPAVQHHVPKPGHKVVIQSLLSREKTSKKHIYVGPIFVHSSHLHLCVDSKSSPGHTLCTTLPLYFPFRPRDSLDDQSVLLSPLILPVCTKSNVHTKFPHPHFISCLNQVQDLTPRSSFTSNNRRRKKVTLDHLIKRG